jgi:hypothetical protein
MTRPLLSLALLLVALTRQSETSQVRSVVVTAGSDGAARITQLNGKAIRVAKERGQVGIRDPQTALDHRTVGWLVEYSIPHLESPYSLYAETLVVWRDGVVRRRFGTEDGFYSWAFYSGGKQVVFHTGPMHFEQQSHCELHDIKSGRRLAEWDGDLESSDKPDWTSGLHH